MTIARRICELEDYIFQLIKRYDDKTTTLLDAFIELLNLYKQSSPNEDFLKYILQNMDYNFNITVTTQNKIYLELLIHNYKHIFLDAIPPSSVADSLFNKYIYTIFNYYSLEDVRNEFDLNIDNNLYDKIINANKKEYFIKAKQMLHQIEIIQKLADQ